MKFAEAPLPRDQIHLIPTCLGDVIPADHPLRLLDELLGQLDWSLFQEEISYERRGRPAIPPRILAAVWMYGFCRRIRSSRQLEYQLRTNIEFMWLAHGFQIDHTTLAIFRQKNKPALRKIQKDLIRVVQQLGVVKLAELYVDGTRIGANASRHQTLTAEKASQLLQSTQQQIDAYLEQVERADQAEDGTGEGVSGERLPEHLNTLQKRQAQLEEILQRCEAMDATRKTQGIDPKKNPFQCPRSDPESRILPNKEGGYAPNYTPIIGVEGELGLIVSATVINSVNEQDYLLDVVKDVEASFAVTVETVGADAAYSTGPNIAALEGAKDFLSPHRQGDPVADNPAIRDELTQPVAEADGGKLPTERGTLAAEAFVYDEARDVYYCPQGRPLTRAYQETRTPGEGSPVTRTVYQSADCTNCPFSARCRTGTGHQSGRRLSRDEHEKVRAAHRRKMATPEAKQRYNKRFSFAERPFAQIKHGFGFRRFQTRGQQAVSSEFSLAVLAHNLLRLTNYLGSRGNLRALLAARG